MTFKKYFGQTLILISTVLFSTIAASQSGNFFKDLENAAKQLNQVTQQNQNPNVY